jgi:hypothetical protein
MTCWIAHTSVHNLEETSNDYRCCTLAAKAWHLYSVPINDKTLYHASFRYSPDPPCKPFEW